MILPNGYCTMELVMSFPPAEISFEQEDADGIVVQHKSY